jgi:fatty acid desaturase
MSISILRSDLALAGGLAALSIALRLVFNARYADADWILRVVGFEPAAGRATYYRRFDAALAPLPFLWCWLDIAVAVRLASVFQHWAAWVPAVVLVSARMRALQEIGHNAVHYAMCRSKEWQWFLSNLFFQFPLMKRDMRSRFVTHVKEHHRNPNDPLKDPNLRRIIDGGMRPGITRAQFYWRLLYPLLPRGFWVNLRTSAVNAWLGNASVAAALTRVAAMILGVGLVWLCGGLPGLFAYAIALLLVYPWFSWLSILAEHRWFCPSERPANRWQMECTNCRPTGFAGWTGWLARQLVFPLSDAYHLVHSLYPYVRWNYLPALDRHLRAHDPFYAAYASEGFLFPRGALPAALSELKDRLTRRTGDLAAWGEDFAIRR